MLSFSTDDLPSGQRFEQWREMRGKALFGVTIELDREHRRDFHGSFHARAVGPAVASEIEASSYRISRTEADIADVAGDSLCLGLQVKGPGALDVGHGFINPVQDGDMTISHSDLPFAARPHSQSSFRYRLLKIPVHDELTLGQPTHDLFAAKPPRGAHFQRPFRTLFAALTSSRTERIIDPVQDVAHAARLALVARGRLAPGMPEVRAAVRAGLHYAALDFMSRNLHRLTLTPGVAATELGVSLRQLHLLFERTDLSFARTLASMRIKAACKLLVEFPALSVTHIAGACGFSSLATFYRAFDGYYGMTPGDMRLEARNRDGDDAPGLQTRSSI